MFLKFASFQQCFVGLHYFCSFFGAGPKSEVHHLLFLFWGFDSTCRQIVTSWLYGSVCHQPRKWNVTSVFEDCPFKHRKATLTIVAVATSAYLKNNYPPENYNPYQGTFEDDFPFPKVGYVSFLEGTFSFCHRKNNLAQHVPTHN